MRKKTNPLIVNAIKLAGSQAKLAIAVGCSQQQVSLLLYGGKVSAEMAIAIERATKSEISRTALRPDVFASPVSSEAAA